MKTDDIKEQRLTSYNGILSDMLIRILKSVGIKTESKLDYIISRYLEREILKKKRLKSKTILQSPSAIKQEVLKTGISFKTFVKLLKNLLLVRKIEFSIKLTTESNITHKTELSIDLNAISD